MNQPVKDRLIIVIPMLGLYYIDLEETELKEEYLFDKKNLVNEQDRKK
jgi:hypothetical protein